MLQTLKPSSNSGVESGKWRGCVLQSVKLSQSRACSAAPLWRSAPLVRRSCGARAALAGRSCAETSPLSGRATNTSSISIFHGCKTRIISAIWLSFSGLLGSKKQPDTSRTRGLALGLAWGPASRRPGAGSVAWLGMQNTNNICDLAASLRVARPRAATRY